MLVAAMGCVDLTRPQVRVSDGPGPVPEGKLEAGPETAVDLDVAVVDVADEVPDAGEKPEVATVEVAPSDSVFDVRPPDAPPAANGSPCENAGQCLTGNCVRGICCDTACGASCFSCAVTGALGTCRPVPAGEDPGEHCVQDPVASCDRDGTCDGAGGCRIYKATTLCAAGTCAGNVETAASTCDGSGACIPGATQSCSPNVCMGASCGKTCTADGQCQTGFFCNGGTCAVKKLQGAACSAANECASTFCADGVCCGSACGNTCFACNVAGSVGSCIAVPVGQDPRNQCLAEAAATCGRAGGCNGSGQCRLHPAGTSCAAGSCTGTTETAARQCNGANVCLTATTRDCSPYLCGPTACHTSCASSAQCQTGRPCAGGRCASIPDLALLWRFEEASGTIAVDESGNGRNGTYTGATGAPVPAVTVPTLQYPNTRSRAFTRASRHFVQLSPLPLALKPTGSVTMSVWYRATTTDSDGQEMISGGNAYSLRLGPSQIELSKRTSAAFVDCRVTVPEYLDGNWHHVAGVISTTSFTIYFDGTPRISCAQAQPISYAMAGPDFVVGRHGDGQSVYDYAGHMDEIRIYTRALAASEVAALAAGGH